MSDSEEPRKRRKVSGDFRAGGNQFIGNEFNLRHGDAHFYSEDKWSRFLQSLRYDRIDERKNVIKENQENTFEWALEDSDASDGVKTSQKVRCPLPNWLRNGHGTFLIQGKPGSGKSTLMKFLVEDERTKSLLKQYYNSAEVHILFHSFWCIGQEELQHSWKGLLCSLACQLADMHQTIAMRLSQPHQLKRTVHDWSTKELLRLLNELIEASEAPHCFFIDGLDELDHCDLGRIEKFIGQLTSLTTTKCKVCLASRPMSDLEGINITSTFEIQDHTAEDIRQHVVKTINYYSRFNKRMSGDEWADKVKQIAETICAKAEGVFLWVDVVLQSVCKGLRISDDLTSIRKRILTLPNGIEKLYRHMLMLHQEDMDANAGEVALIFGMSQYFPIGLTQLTLACNVPIRASYVETDEVSRFEKSHLEILEVEFMNRLHTLSAGFLEYKSNDDSLEVQFIHRTAREFLQNDKLLPHLAFTAERANEKTILHAYVDSYLTCLTSGVYKFSSLKVMKLIANIARSDFVNLAMLGKVDNVCTALFRAIDDPCAIDLPNWVSFLTIHERIHFRARDFASLIAALNPSMTVWSQLYDRDGPSWSRYFKGHLLTCAIDGFWNSGHEESNPHEISSDILPSISKVLLNTHADTSTRQFHGSYDYSIAMKRSPSVTILAHLWTVVCLASFTSRHIREILDLLQCLKVGMEFEEELTFHCSTDDFRLEVTDLSLGFWPLERSSISVLLTHNARQVCSILEDMVEACGRNPEHIGKKRARQSLESKLIELQPKVHIWRKPYLISHLAYVDEIIQCPASLQKPLVSAIKSKNISAETKEELAQAFNDKAAIFKVQEVPISDLIFNAFDARNLVWQINPAVNVDKDNWLEAYTFYTIPDLAECPYFGMDDW